MPMEITQNYGNYPSYSKIKSGENKNISETDKSRAESNEEYLEMLNRKFPELKIETGSFLSIQNDHKISFKIHPALLEKMRNDPEQEKETMELLKGAVQARKLIEALHKATGHEYVFSHDYVDENGKFHHTSLSVSKNPINEKMRKKAQEDTEKRINASIKKARIKRKELIDMIRNDVSGIKVSKKNTDTLEISDEAPKSAGEYTGIFYNNNSGAVESNEKNKDSGDETKTEESSGNESSESESMGTKVAVNVGKRARMIAAAGTKSEVQTVMQILQGDLSDCQNGLKNGWCDESEVAKVESLIEMANQRMSEVARNEENDSSGLSAFQMSMLF